MSHESLVDHRVYGFTPTPGHEWTERSQRMIHAARVGRPEMFFFEGLSQTEKDTFTPLANRWYVGLGTEERLAAVGALGLSKVGSRLETMHIAELAVAYAYDPSEAARHVLHGLERLCRALGDTRMSLSLHTDGGLQTNQALDRDFFISQGYRATDDPDRLHKNLWEGR